MSDGIFFREIFCSNYLSIDQDCLFFREIDGIIRQVFFPNKLLFDWTMNINPFISQTDMLLVVFCSEFWFKKQFDRKYDKAAHISPQINLIFLPYQKMA